MVLRAPSAPRASQHGRAVPFVRPVVLFAWRPGAPGPDGVARRWFRGAWDGRTAQGRERGDVARHSRRLDQPGVARSTRCGDSGASTASELVSEAELDAQDSSDRRDLHGAPVGGGASDSAGPRARRPRPETTPPSRRPEQPPMEPPGPSNIRSTSHVGSRSSSAGGGGLCCSNPGRVSWQDMKIMAGTR